jgi:hypothetical protein
MLLQSVENIPLGYQIGGVVLVLSNLGSMAVIVKMSYQVGRWVEQLQDMERRLKRVEDNECPYDQCPLKGHLGFSMKPSEE